MDYRKRTLTAAVAILGMTVPAGAFQPVAQFQGAIVGEIRPFAFGGDETVVAFVNGGQLVSGTLRDFGWIECRGQSLNDADFPELAGLLKKVPLAVDSPPRADQIVSSIWGALDLKHNFLIPDLRGLFLRGSMPSPPVSPDPAGEPGDGRGAPRPDMVAAGSDPGTKVGTEVGSFQADAVGRHRHELPTNGGGRSCCSAQTMGSVPVLSNKLMSDDGRDSTTDAPLGAETRPRNVHVMYCIWTGRKVTGAAIAAAEQPATPKAPAAP